MTKYRIVDAHCDTLYGIVLEGKAPEDCTVRPENLRRGGVSLQTFAMFAGAQGREGHPYENAVAMLASSERIGVPMLKGALPENLPDAPHGVFSIEGGEVLEGKLSRLHEFDASCRVRMIALTWNNENEIGYPAVLGDGGHLKPFGLELLSEMDALGILADVSHLNVAGFWDCAERTKLPIIASHSNLRTLCDVRRNLYPDQVRAIIEKKGFIGINFYSAFLAKDRDATLDDVLRHIDGIAELGGIDVLGFGSDFDGIDASPEGLSSPDDFPKLMALLEDHGYTEAQLRGIAGENLFRVLKAAKDHRT
ncbi:MAG: dipeptidase [Christensenellales bacterium]|jgi:membrane dipeptidase